MSHAARVLPPEPDDESDLRRRAEAQRQSRLATLNALANAPIGANSVDRDHVLQLRKTIRDDVTLTTKQAERIAALAWKYRRLMPRGTAPVLPPHDPIVRAMEAANV